MWLRGVGRSDNSSVSGPGGSAGFTVRFVLTDQGWKVFRPSYCSTMSALLSCDETS